MSQEKNFQENAKKIIISFLEERKATYNPLLARALEGVNPALLLSQLISLAEKQPERNGWINRTMEELLEETGLSRAEQETARRKLRVCNILKEKKAGLPMKIYFKIDLEKVLETLTEYVEKKKIIDLKKAEEKVRNKKLSNLDLLLLDND